jgi:hypothetical protein
MAGCCSDVQTKYPNLAIAARLGRFGTPDFSAGFEDALTAETGKGASAAVVASRA